MIDQKLSSVSESVTVS